VFAADEGTAPLAVTALTAGEHLLVRPDAGRTDGDYAPSYVRRSPLIGMTPAEGEAILLGVGRSAGHATTNAVHLGLLAPLVDRVGRTADLR
jgi:hypothetical protein